MRDTLYTHALAVNALDSSAISTDTTTAGETVDLGVFDNDFRTALFVVHAGAITDGEYAVTLEDSATGSGDWTAVPVSKVQGVLPTIADSDSDKLFQFGYIVGAKRYVRLSIASTETDDGGVLSAVAVLGSGSFAPIKRA